MHLLLKAKNKLRIKMVILTILSTLHKDFYFADIIGPLKFANRHATVHT